MGKPTIESSTRSRSTDEVVVIGKQDGKPFVVRLDGKMIDLATDPEWFLADAVDRALRETR